MKKSIEDIYLDAIRDAILSAGGGREGVVNVPVAAMALTGVAAQLVGMLPRNASKAMAKDIAASFQGLVSSVRKDIDRSSSTISFVTQQ